MSETTEQPGTPAPEPEPVPASDTPAPEPNRDEPEQKQQREADEEGRRVAQVRARLGATERERDQLRAENEYYRRQAQSQAPQQETPEQAMRRIEAEADARAEERLLTRRFHQEGYEQYRDWDQKRADLVAMGADAGIGRLLIEMPGGVRVAAALAEEPTELQRIASIQSERGRAIALGKFAASIEQEGRGDNGHARASAPPVSRAPAPIRPVTGRAAPTFNEYTADGNTLVDRYMKQDLESRMRR